VAVVLYTALTDLRVYSAIDDWPCPAGSTVPLDPSRPTTVRLLAEGKIALAADGASDNTTPAAIVRGQPGIKAPGSVSN
jgi:hypothetical protein